MKRIFEKALGAFAVSLMLAGCSESANTNGNTVVQEAESAPLSIGITGKADGLDFTLNTIEQRSQIGPSGVGQTASPTEVYVIARYALKNTSKKPLSLFERPDVTLVDGDGQVYAKDDMAGAMALEAGEAAGMNDLNPGVGGKAVAVWKVDKKAFDLTKWRLVVATNPTLTYALDAAPGRSK